MRRESRSTRRATNDRAANLPLFKEASLKTGFAFLFPFFEFSSFHY
jgi:hypothetical protein